MMDSCAALGSHCQSLQIFLKLIDARQALDISGCSVHMTII